MKLRRQKIAGWHMETLSEFWSQNIRELTCKVIGHTKYKQEKFGGEQLCKRCFHDTRGGKK